MSGVIMAIDRGQFKGVGCLDRRSIREAAFHTIDTDGGALAALFAERPDGLLVIAASARSGFWGAPRVRPRCKNRPGAACVSRSISSEKVE